MYYGTKTILKKRRRKINAGSQVYIFQTRFFLEKIPSLFVGIESIVCIYSISQNQ